ncbi:hypothetical protein BsWGS_05073 [Bradybaena similaris]
MAVTRTSCFQNECVRKFTSCRWILAFMLCLLRMCQTSLRQSIGMVLVCMAERPPVQASVQGNDSDVRSSVDEINATLFYSTVQVNQTGGLHGVAYTVENSSITIQAQAKGHEFVWDAPFEGIVLSAYYYGYLLTPLLSCYMERFFGAKQLVACCVAVGAVVNLLTPELTRLNKYMLVALRVIAGTTNGMIDPAVQSLWAAWAPRSEVAYLTAVEYAGVSLGGIFTFLVSGLLCQIPLDNGWPLVCYFYGTLSAIWVALCVALVYNKPADHPRILSDELIYIAAETQSFQSKRNKIHPPWLKIMGSPAVWAIIVASTSFMWVYSWILCYLPMYMQDVLHYNISQNAVLSSLPFVGKFISGLVCGYLADRLLKTRMTVSCNRKMFQTIGCLGCAVCTVIVSYLDSSSRDIAVVLLTLGVTLQNVTTVAFRINPLDIAPRYASFILALSNTVAVAVSMTAPLVTSAIVFDKTQEQWQVMFYIVAALSVVGGLVFLFLGKASVQDWAKPPDKHNEDLFVNAEDHCGFRRDSEAGDHDEKHTPLNISDTSSGMKPVPNTWSAHSDI